MRSDARRARTAAGLHDVGVERALDEELDRVPLGGLLADDVPGRLLERPDELPPDDLPLLLGVGHPGERGEELVLGVHDDEVDARRLDEVLLDLRGLVLPEQAVVDEDARQLVPDRPLDERGRDGGVDATGEGAQDPTVADRLADEGHLVLDDVPRGPVRLDARAAQEEVLDDPLAEGAVEDLRVPLDAVETTVVVLERRDGSTHVSGPDRGQLDDFLHTHSVAEMWEMNLLGCRPTADNVSAS